MATGMEQPTTDPSGGNEDQRRLETLLVGHELVQEIPTAAGSLQVVTRISLDPHAWWYRSSVTQNGAELSEGPWAPVVNDLSQELATFTITDGMRLAFAREAVDVHLSRVAELERQLGVRKGGTAAARPKILPIAAVLLVVVAAGIGGALWYFQERKVVPESPTPALARDEPGETTPAGSEPQQVTKAKEEPVAETTPPSVETPKPPMGASSPRKERPTDRDREVSTPAKEKNPAPGVDVEDEEPARGRREPRPDSGLFLQISPSGHGLTLLASGNPVYRNSSFVYEDVPKTFQGLTCLRLANEEGEERSVSFTLSRRAQVIVAHDRRIKRRPDWLESFQDTGEELRVARGGEGKDFFYRVYSKDLGPGRIELGPGSKATKTGKWIRGVLDKERNMYVVCAR
jgi:hypothetical protein